MLINILAVISGLMPFWLFTFWITYERLSGPFLRRFLLALPFGIKSIPSLIYDMFHYKQTEAYAQNLRLIEIGNFNAMLPLIIADYIATIGYIFGLVLTIGWLVCLAKNYDVMDTHDKLVTPITVGASYLLIFFIIEAVFFVLAALPFLLYIFPIGIVGLIIIFLSNGTPPDPSIIISIFIKK